jgi:ferrous iron transport protein B
MTERAQSPGGAERAKILIVGHPNVGKSALFNRLTGQHATVSNYPGTTVEVSRGHCHALGRHVEVLDTPGMYSFLPITDEERVASDMLFAAGIRAVVHVVDAKNLEHMLGLTLQLIEAGLPVVVALNMFDEARDLDIRMDVAQLRARLGVPVVPTVSTTGEGYPELLAALQGPYVPSPLRLEYGTLIEDALRAISEKLAQGPAEAPGPQPDCPAFARMSPRARASLILQGDARQSCRLVRELGERGAAEILEMVADARARLNHSPHYYITLALRTRVDQLLSECVQAPRRPPSRLRQTLDTLCTSPWTGFPILALVLYFALFKFVGGFGAGTVVDWLETNLFEKGLNVWATKATLAAIPWPAVQDLVVGEFGLVTLGLRYAVAIIMPIVTTFFLVFAVLEDSGYLPRLALLVDRGFKRLGLNGRAVIPVVLGFGCDTMATVVTRTLETTRERLICTFLLALAVPCSAQLGVILALLAGHSGAVLIWAGVLAAVMVAAGALAARVLPGERPVFYMEIPPLRLPRLGNILSKTVARMQWYFLEVLPTFLLASVLLWLGKITNVFPKLLHVLEPVVRSLGLPNEAATAFLFGFFRRDYGAAGLYDLQKTGVLNGNQLTVAALVLTLFLPCVAQFLVMGKERGWKATLIVSAAILAIAWTIGFATNQAFGALGVNL